MALVLQSNPYDVSDLYGRPQVQRHLALAQRTELRRGEFAIISPLAATCPGRC
jgi:hypothetical protein